MYRLPHLVQSIRVSIYRRLGYIYVDSYTPNYRRETIPLDSMALVLYEEEELKVKSVSFFFMVGHLFLLMFTWLDGCPRRLIWRSPIIYMPKVWPILYTSPCIQQMYPSVNVSAFPHSHTLYVIICALV